MRLTQPTRDGIRKWRWQFAIRRLRAAYDAARSSIDNDLRDVQSDHDEFQAAPKPDPDDYDEVAAHGAWESHIIDRWEDAQGALAALKQAFAVILYHTWERHSAEWAEWTGNYRHHRVAPRLTDAGYTVAKGVHKLNKVANCIKHDSAELWKQKEYRAMFDPLVAAMVAEDIKPDFGRYLILTDADMDEFFVALLESGPPGPPTAGF